MDDSKKNLMLINLFHYLSSLAPADEKLISRFQFYLFQEGFFAINLIDNLLISKVNGLNQGNPVHTV